MGPIIFQFEAGYISLIFVCTCSTNMVGAERQKLETSDSRSLEAELGNSESHKKDKRCLGRVCLPRLLDTRGIDFISDKPTLYCNYYMLRFQVGSNLKGHDWFRRNS